MSKMRTPALPAPINEYFSSLVVITYLGYPFNSSILYLEIGKGEK